MEIMQCLRNTCIVYVGDVAEVSKEFINIHEVGTHFFILLCLKKTVHALDYSSYIIVYGYNLNTKQSKG